MRPVNSFLSIAALVVGVVALLVAISAYNRTGENIVDVAEETVQETGERLEETGDRLQEQVSILDVQTKLMRIQADIQSERVDEDTEMLIAETRQEARELNIDTNIQSQLQTLENQVRSGSADALRTVESVLSDLRVQIEADN